MKKTLLALFAIAVLFAAGCGKQNTSKTTDVKSVSEKIENIEYNCLPGAVQFYKNLIRAEK